MPSLRKFLRSAMLPTDTLLSYTTEQQGLAEFMAMVQPVATNHELICVGGEADGGYLLPDDLAGISTCFSPTNDPLVIAGLRLSEKSAVSRGHV